MKFTINHKSTKINSINFPSFIIADASAREHDYCTSENETVSLTEACTSADVEHDMLSREWFREDEERVTFYTGLPNMITLEAIFDLIHPRLQERKSMTKFQQFILTLMKMRLNLLGKDLAYRFKISESVVSNVFRDTIDVMYVAMGFLIIWPGKEELKLTMPKCFRGKFSDCVVIIDCFEIAIQKPSDLLAQAQTWSSYKQRNTAKYLIGITPQGTISFISKGWGGRASDKCIVEASGFLLKVEPGDLVLADRGFDIDETLALQGARLYIPAFTKGKAQLSPVETEETRHIANVRIHVERVIGLVRKKYKILGHAVIPIHYLVSKNSQVCLLDKLVLVACALTNCCKSIVMK